MKIGNVTLDNNVFLAPMAGVTDLPFRLLCKEMGCGLVYSEMVSAKGILYNNKNTTELLQVEEAERPTAIQLFGSDPKILGEMGKKIEPYPFDIIDVNMAVLRRKSSKTGRQRHYKNTGTGGADCKISGGKPEEACYHQIP